jgi:DNA (cytosine-5)-methyltransferase 1
LSGAGRGRGKYDPRDVFPLALHAVDAGKPTRVCLENVSNLASSRFDAYRRQILRDLAQRYAHVGMWILNAKDFGVPQDRARVFLWGAEIPLDAPAPTHGPGTGQPYVSVQAALPGLIHEGYNQLIRAMTTARSRAMAEPGPSLTTRRNLYAIRSSRRVRYQGASSLPAKKRLLTPEEEMVLQSFPATFGFVGNMQERQRQIGNAVPPPLAAAVTAAMTVGLTPRRTTPTELLESMRVLDDAIDLYEPRPWMDQALIGVTTMKEGAPGKLIAVYDSAAMKDAVWDAYVEQAAAEHKITGKDVVTKAKTLERKGLLQQVENDALSWLYADKQSRYRSDAPVVVPVATLKELGLPVATMLLPERQISQALEQATAPYTAETGQEPYEVVQQILAQYAEILDY